VPQFAAAELLFEVPFHDVDMLEVAWHGHHYKYFELGRTALFRKYGLDVADMKAMRIYMVVIESHCRYRAPLKYGRNYLCKIALVELEYRVKITYTICDAESDQVMAKGYTVQVCVDGESQEMFMMTPEKVCAIFAGEGEGN
jgi:acyl-CoA thioester hydrolase